MTARLKLPRWVLAEMTKKEKRDFRALQALASGATPTQAAAKASISVATLYRRGIARRAREIKSKHLEAKAG
jgi:hypothetical protein